MEDDFCLLVWSKDLGLLATELCFESQSFLLCCGIRTRSEGKHFRLEED